MEFSSNHFKYLKGFKSFGSSGEVSDWNPNAYVKIGRKVTISDKHEKHAGEEAVICSVATPKDGEDYKNMVKVKLKKGDKQIAVSLQDIIF